jgi:hypothetical protein
MFRPVASRAMLLGALALVFACEEQDVGLSVSHGDAGVSDATAATSDAQEPSGLSRQPTPTPADGSSRDSLPRFDAGTSSDGAPSLVSVERACAMKAQSMCTRLFACAPYPSAVRFGDRVRCVARTEASCVEEARAPDTGLNATNLIACATQVDSASCDDLLTRTMEVGWCWARISGRRETGKPCGASSQCASNYCRVDGACGTCAAKIADGQPCPNDEACGPGRVCSRAGTCALPGSKGAACDDRSAPCLPTLSCVDKRCTTPLPQGATCEQAAQCDALAANCVGLSGVDRNACVNRTVAQPGAACGEALGGPIGCFGGDDLCRGDGNVTRCVAPAADDAECGTSGRALPCAWPAACVGGTCRLPSPTTCK